LPTDENQIKGTKKVRERREEERRKIKRLWLFLNFVSKTVYENFLNSVQCLNSNVSKTKIHLIGKADFYDFNLKYY